MKMNINFDRPIPSVLKDEYGNLKEPTVYSARINEYIFFAYWNEDDYSFCFTTRPEEIRHRMYLLSSILFEEIPPNISINNLNSIVGHLRIVAEEHKDKTPNELSTEYRNRLAS